MFARSWYHSSLRVAAVLLAATLAFESGLFAAVTADLARETRHYLANAVGVQASVEPNELNEITAALTEQRQDLEAREAALEQREIAVDLNGDGAPVQSGDRATYIMSALLFILLVLIVLNYALDYARARHNATYENRNPNPA